MRQTGAGRHIPVLMATTILVAGSDAGILLAVAQEQTTLQAVRDANAQAITLDTINVQGDAGRTDGYVANSTSVATKTNTPLINIPQSISVVTKDFIKDQNFQSITDVTRYVPGVAVHQGEGNRDELVIRGVDSSANFFVNGFRDDVQYFRDLYNTQSIEILKGPSALTFGRGAGGGVVNRTLKEADGTHIYETTLQTGSYGGRRIAVDAGQAVNQNFAARLNAFYEGSDTFRNYGKLERYGFNPTVAFTPNDSTKIKLSYEYFHDQRTADRGNPSQALSAVAPASTRFNPATPFAPNGDLTAFFGGPDLNVARANVQMAMAFIEHDFGGGLTAKNGTLLADYKKFYQNVYPGNGPLGGAVNPADTRSTMRPITTKLTGRISSIRPTSFSRPPRGRSFTQLRSERSLAGRPSSMSATPGYFRMEPTRRSAIRSIRPISDPSPSSISIPAPFHPASPRQTLTADIASIRYRLMRAIRSNLPVDCN